jgi:hypothetical protein
VFLVRHALLEQFWWHFAVEVQNAQGSGAVPAEEAAAGCHAVCHAQHEEGFAEAGASDDEHADAGDHDVAQESFGRR